MGMQPMTRALARAMITNAKGGVVFISATNAQSASSRALALAGLELAEGKALRTTTQVFVYPNTKTSPLARFVVTL